MFSLPLFSQSLQSPEQTFGFRMGTDRKLINWDQIHSYFKMLDKHSTRVNLVELGKTTLNRPMIMAVISSQTTMANLTKYKSLQKKLAQPYAVDDYTADAYISEGKVIFLITLNIHSTEIASSQESVELAYELATSQDPKIKKILDNIIILLVPSLNPDGQDMITKWYLKDVGTEYEGSRMPMKYHHYADHDNNRDWFFFNLIESLHVAKVLYHEWFPEVILDQHQMGYSRARFFLPPYADPVNPNVSPLLMAQVNMLGKHVVANLHQQDFKGVVTGTIFNAYFEGTMSKTPLWHNRIGILTEAASVHVASPIFFPKSSLRGMGIDLPEYAQQTNFLAPWQGGWWKLRDIIDIEKAATYSMLDLAATYKEDFKRTFYNLNTEAIAKGTTEPPFAYVIPTKQNDPNNAIELLRRLRMANVRIYKINENITLEDKIIRENSFIIPLAQPSRAYIKDIMEAQHYPFLSEYPNGPPRQPYDVTAWTLPLQMGVETFVLNEPVDWQLELVNSPKLDLAEVYPDSGWVAIERRYNHSYKAVNQLLRSGALVYSLQENFNGFPRGTFLTNLDALDSAKVASIFKSNEVPISSFPVPENFLPEKEIKKNKIGIYQPWLPNVYDEGWLRLIFDNFDFDYGILHNEDFQSRSKLINHFDVLIFGNQSSKSIVNGLEKEANGQTIGSPLRRKEYTGGIGTIGLEKIIQFFQDGGTVLFFGEACDLAIEELNFPATNILKDIPKEEYFAPGSIFELILSKQSNLTYGLPSQVAIYKSEPLALKLDLYNKKIIETGYFGEKNVLLSGWVVGEKKLNNKIGLVEIPVGNGLAILYAFRPNHRGQTYGTFKLIFNALYQ